MNLLYIGNRNYSSWSWHARETQRWARAGLMRNAFGEMDTGFAASRREFMSYPQRRCIACGYSTEAVRWEPQQYLSRGGIDRRFVGTDL